MPQTDTELVARIKHGDKSAFQELVRRHADSMLGMAYSLVGNLADAEDVVQDSLLVALRRIHSFEGRSTIGTWLRGILIFRAAKLRRSRGIRRAAPLLDQDGSDSEAGDASLATRSPAAAVDSKTDVSTMLATLSQEHREIIVLRELQQLSYEEISALLKLPIGTVESRLYRARQELKKRFGGRDE